MDMGAQDMALEIKMEAQDKALMEAWKIALELQFQRVDTESQKMALVMEIGAQDMAMEARKEEKK